MADLPSLPERVEVSIDVLGQAVGHLRLMACAGDCEADTIGEKLSEEVRRALDA